MKKLDLLSIGKTDILILIIFFIAGCSFKGNELKNHLEKLKERYPTISVNGWEILDFENYLNKACYTLKRTNSDTTVYMETCKVSHDSIWNPGDDYYAIGSYRKSYSNGQYEHIINGFEDTNYHIKYMFAKPDSIIFISGKYYYQYRYGLLNKNQKTFYVNHSDSLDKLRGNDLPELPGK